jgi:hypothetical protein
VAKVAAKKADKAAKVAEKGRKEVEAETAKDKLAEMEVDESFIERQEQQGRVRRQSDMGAGRSNNLDDLEEEFANLMDLDFSSDTSETDSETDGELETLTKKRGHGAAAQPATAATVGLPHLNCHLDETYCYIQTSMKGKKKAQPKLRDEVAVKKNKMKEVGKKYVAIDLIR